MRIDINQKKISIGDKYKIFVDQKETYSASSELFKLLSVINLYETGNTTPVLTIKKRWSWMKPKYNIIMSGGQTLDFRAESFWKMHYLCSHGGDVYHVYGHRGRKYSVYKNETQVAWWEKQAVSWFAGDNYVITTGSDSTQRLIIAFCLIIDNHKSEQHQPNGVSIDPGNIGREVRKFDPYWQPRVMRD